MKYASAKLCKELWVALGKPEVKIADIGLYPMGARGKCLALPGEQFNLGDFKEFVPAYDVGELIDMALGAGHVHVKIKQTAKRAFVVTAPPCYHIEATTPANGLAKLLIKSAKVLTNKGE